MCCSISLKGNMALVYRLTMVSLWLSWIYETATLEPIIHGDPLTRREALKACHQEKHAFLGKQDINNSHNNKTLLNKLSINDDMWISDIPEYSTSFAAYLGCWAPFDADGFIPNGVYECSKVCNTQFIGLVGEKCTCINVKPEDSKRISVLVCNKTCSNGLVGDICGGDNAMSVYEMVKESDVTVIPDESQYKQCVTLSKDGTGEILLARESCAGHCDNCGAICTPCNGSTGVVVIGEAPRINIASWEYAQKVCTQRNHCLLTNLTAVRDPVLVSKLNSTYRYWTGLFRPFQTKISTTNTFKNDTTSACIFTRKVEPALLQFWAASCSERKPYACLGEKSKPIEPTTKQATAATLKSTTKEMQSATVGESKRTTNAKLFTESPSGGRGTILPVWTIAVIVAAATAVVVVLAAFTVLCVKRRGKKHATIITGIPEPSPNNPIFSDKNSHTSGAVAHGPIVSNRDHPVHQQKENLVVSPSMHYDFIPDTDQDYAEINEDDVDEKAKLKAPLTDAGVGKLSPRKPERRTLKRKQDQTDENNSDKAKQEEEYNVLNEFQTSPTDHEYVCNVYNHLDALAGTGTSDMDTVYDHTGHPGTGESGANRHVTEVTNLYGCPSDVKDGESGATTEESVYNRTFERNKRVEISEDTYNTLQTNTES